MKLLDSGTAIDKHIIVNYRDTAGTNQSDLAAYTFGSSSYS